MTRHCTCCGKPFEPRPQVPDQSFCSTPDCQRARKRQWQRAKLQSDPDYRINQRAAQQAWSQRNQDYWRNYRDARPEYAQRNREQQRSRDQGRNGDLAKMDACDLPSGLYRITRHPALLRGNGDSWVVEITPVCMTCPCKMDVSREDVIDTSAACPYFCFQTGS
ncbi:MULTISPECIES: hypothetical protein [Burkholderiaceae]|uniref:Uncharacterized protein n=1 Tax=Ralstonia mannitolilytica TaxID=105219 RepID=A0AAJ4ZN91_9RALS|nr:MULTISPECIES: hypothetical protein [Burkholderiaceae]MCM3604033.1 DUF2116 family Zn-ribbon domain-containing protein [Cupriavidus pauculus]CAG2149504.1 hypothetical protein LMG6866_03677 [Ralstonia mannitolilytica]CAJ0861023.1 hypothetical protein R77569_01397 [Ralstonia mannitolilytica]SUD89217.1 Uncharacterised protein [Ralstonia mannitolilytica]SUD98706.1 Uncharacterised protein [Ralstonia mannitolilytica]